MDNVLIDSDVILDVILNRKAFQQYSGEILNLCDRRKIKGITTSIIISNVHNIAKKEMNRAKAEQAIEKLVEIIDIIPVSKKAISNALSSRFQDFEDAMQNFAAIENGKITTIITRNIKDYKHSILKVAPPKEYLMQQG